MTANKTELKNILENLGKNIEKRMKEIGMSRKTLAEKIGVSQNSVSGYIRGIQSPRFDSLYNISVALGVSIIELVGGDVYIAQTQSLIEKAQKQSVYETELAIAKETLEGLGFECYRKDSGDWQLFRQKTLNDFLEIISDGAKVRYIKLPNDETVISLSDIVRKAAIDNLNGSAAIKDLTERLDKFLTVV